MGIPSFAMGDEHFPLGYDGIIRMGEALVGILARKKFNAVLKRHVVHPYSQWWLEQDDPFVIARDPEVLAAAPTRFDSEEEAKAKAAARRRLAKAAEPAKPAKAPKSAKPAKPPKPAKPLRQKIAM